MNVIFIDDDEDLNYLQERMCKRSKAINSYFIATSAVQTLEYLANPKANPDVIFVDINMPGMNGFQFIEEFEHSYASTFPDTELYVLSSSVRSGDREKSLQYSSVREFLVKPLTEEKFSEICLQKVDL